MAKEQGGLVPFHLYPGQEELAARLLGNQWVWLVKTRRCGATTVVLAVMLWLQTFRRNIRAIVASQDKDTARNILRIYMDMYDTLPPWMRQPLSADTQTEASWELTGSAIRTVAASERGARSDTLDMLLVDEAAFVQQLQPTLDACEPTLETSAGVSCVMSTSNGPANLFCTGYRASKSKETKYVSMFLGWQSRPDRDDAWYQEQHRLNRFLPNKTKREYPRNDVECFTAAGGQALVGLNDEVHFMQCEQPKGAHIQRFRSMDLGWSVHHPTVVLWGWHDPKATPRLTFDPEGVRLEVPVEIRDHYPNGLDQLFAYRRHPETDELIKDEDDAADALRYMVVSGQCYGHLHIYRMLFLRPTEYDAVTPSKIANLILEMSGWERLEEITNKWRRTKNVEKYDMTIVDASARPFYSQVDEMFTKFGFDMAMTPHFEIKGVPEKRQVEAGVVWINSLLTGSHPIHYDLTRAKIAEQRDKAEQRKRDLEALRAETLAKGLAAMDRRALQKTDAIGRVVDMDEGILDVDGDWGGEGGGVW